MPALKWMGIEFSIGSDDFFLLAALGILSRLVLVAINGVFIAISHCISCVTKEDIIFAWLLWFLLLVTLGSLTVCCAMLHISISGTPTDNKYRDSKIPYTFVTFGVIYILEFAFAVVFLVLCFVFHTVNGCLIAITVILWVDLIGILEFYFVFLRKPRLSKLAKIYDDEEVDKELLKYISSLHLFGKLLRILSCNLFGQISHEDDYKKAITLTAKTIKSWFEDTDLIFTDILAALVLIHYEQKARRNSIEDKILVREGKASPYRKTYRRKKYFNVNPTSIVIPKETTDIQEEANQIVDLESGRQQSSATVSEKMKFIREGFLPCLARHVDFMPYMLGIYGWKLRAFRDIFDTTLRNRIRNTFHITKPNENKAGFIQVCKCAWNRNALLSENGLANSYPLYIDLRNILQIPHALFLDRKRKAIVVTIRGTLSMSDLLIDAMVEPVSLEEAGLTWGFNGKGHYAHMGMLKTAMQIRSQIEYTRILHKLFNVPESECVNIDDCKNFEGINIELDPIPTDCADYQLVVLGHSLGAGVAAILTLLLRPKFPHAQCLAYSCPGSIFDFDLAEKSEAWCSTIWVGNDIVVYLNWKMLERLRIQIFDTLRRCKISKARIFCSVFCSKFCNLLKNSLYKSSEAVPFSDGKAYILQKLHSFRERQQSLNVQKIPLYVPGRLVYLAETETIEDRFKLCICKNRKKSIFEPFSINDRKALEQPYISISSLLSHFPNRVADVITQTYREFDHEMVQSIKEFLLDSSRRID